MRDCSFQCMARTRSHRTSKRQRQPISSAETHRGKREGLLRTIAGQRMCNVLQGSEEPMKDPMPQGVSDNMAVSGQAAKQATAPSHNVATLCRTVLTQTWQHGITAACVTAAAKARREPRTRHQRGRHQTTSIRENHFNAIAGQRVCNARKDSEGHTKGSR